MLVLMMILFGIPTILLSVDFIQFAFTGKRLYPKVLNTLLQVAGMLLLPIIYLSMFDENSNDCCTDSATFSPKHKLTIYVLIGICISSYFYSCYKKSISSPVIEVLINTILLFGFIFNIFVAIQVEQFFWLWGNIPVGLLFLFQLIETHNKFLNANPSFSTNTNNFFEKTAWGILTLHPFFKIPLLLILCIPILTIITSLLLLFGQKPDSLISAFTDTYKHGFSTLDHLCDNVECGGHFLCSVAANGHKKIVTPIRYGERNGNNIICNRQLLIANAFEELIQQKLPKTHKCIRTQYNKVGNMIHRHYHLFNNKWIADFIYFLMKPLEIFFLLTIYTFDKTPENRIAAQYLSKADRKKISNIQTPVA